jgi:hypothetical protein
MAPQPDEISASKGRSPLNLTNLPRARSLQNLMKFRHQKSDRFFTRHHDFFYFFQLLTNFDE